MAAGVGKLGAFVGVFLVPHLQNSIGLRGMLGVAAGASVLGVLLTRLLPEPGNRGLDEVSGLTSFGAVRSARRQDELDIEQLPAWRYQAAPSAVGSAVLRSARPTLHGCQVAEVPCCPCWRLLARRSPWAPAPRVRQPPRAAPPRPLPSTTSTSGQPGSSSTTGKPPTTQVTTTGFVAMQTANGGEFLAPSGSISCELNYKRSGLTSASCQTTTPPRPASLNADGTYTTCTGTNCLGKPGSDNPNPGLREKHRRRPLPVFVRPQWRDLHR